MGLYIIFIFFHNKIIRSNSFCLTISSLYARKFRQYCECCGESRGADRSPTYPLVGSTPTFSGTLYLSLNIACSGLRIMEALVVSREQLNIIEDFYSSL